MPTVPGPRSRGLSCGPTQTVLMLPNRSTWMAPRMAKSKKWIFQSMKSTICGRSIIASLHAIFSVRAVERITGSLQLTMPPGPDTHHSVGA